MVEDKEVLAKLQSHAFDQPKVTENSHFLVLCARTSMDQDYIDSSMEKFAAERGQNVTDLDGFKSMIQSAIMTLSDTQKQIWMEKQVYIALGFLLSACMDKKIDACPMEGFSRDVFNEVLALPEKGWTATVCCAIGYRADDDAYAQLKKVRWGEDELVEKV